MLIKYRKKIRSMKNKTNNNGLLTSDHKLKDNKSGSPKAVLESTERIDTKILKRNIENKLKNYNK